MAIVARRLRGEPLELVARETNVSIARLTEWRDRALAGAATALKERERDDRDDEIARLKSKVGEITMDNELRQDRGAGGQTPFGPKEAETMSQTLSPSLWLAPSTVRRAGGEDLARQRISSLSQGDAAEPERPSPWSGWRMFGPEWQTTSASTSPPPAFTARATASYGRDCASRAFAQVPGVCDG